MGCLSWLSTDRPELRRAVDIPPIDRWMLSPYPGVLVRHIKSFAQNRFKNSFAAGSHTWFRRPRDKGVADLEHQGHPPHIILTVQVRRGSITNAGESLPGEQCGNARVIADEGARLHSMLRCIAVGSAANPAIVR